jgi:hypothetical protein
LRNFDKYVLLAIALIGLTLLILPRLVGRERQLVTVKVSRAGVPVPQLLLHLKFDDRFGCDGASGSFNRTGSTDAAGLESWTRPAPRRRRGRLRGAFDGFFDDVAGSKPVPSETIRICAAAEDTEQVIFSEPQEGRERRRLDVTCDLAAKAPCFGVYTASLESNLVPWVFLPLCVLLGVAMDRAPNRPMGRDMAGLGVAVALAVLSGQLQRYWFVSQVLAVASVLAVIVALACTLAANSRFRASNR